MADTKISDLTELAAAPAVGDLLVVVDVSDGTMAPSGTDKKITAANLLANVQPLDAQLTSVAGLSYTGNALKVIRVNAGETDFELAAGSGDFSGPASSDDNAVVRFDGTGGKTGQNSAVTISDVSGASVSVATTAGNALAVLATAPAAANGASQAGKSLSVTASAAVASLDTAGAAAGGDVTLTAGAAARLTSGNANGGNINLVTGAGIGTGTIGQVLFPDVGNTPAAPSFAFAGDANTGIYRQAADSIGFATAGTVRFLIGSSQLTAVVDLLGNSAGAALSGFKTNIANRTADASESGTTSYTVVTNAGASALVTRTLPTAATGWVYTFACLDTDGIKIQAAAGDDIRVIDKITAAAGYIQSTTIGSIVTLVAMDATTWLATSINGVWTDGTFTYDDTSLTTP